MFITTLVGIVVMKQLRPLLVRENYEILNVDIVNFKSLTSLIRFPVQTTTDYGLLPFW